MEALIEMHAWTVARPRHETSIATDGVNSKLVKFEQVEKEQGMLFIVFFFMTWLESFTGIISFDVSSVVIYMPSFSPDASICLFEKSGYGSTSSLSLPYTHHTQKFPQYHYADVGLFHHRTNTTKTCKVL